MTIEINNDNDELLIDGVSVEELATKYGTPIYVYSEKDIISNYKKLDNAFIEAGMPINLFYAIKACNNLNIARILVGLGAGIDAASPNEIKMAKELGLNGDKTIFTGNNLSDQDILYALENNAVFNVDDDSILPRVFSKGIPRCISFRINPGGNESVTGKLTFGGAQAKFGIDPSNVISAYSNAHKAGVKKFGVHMMPGSCALSVDYFIKNTETLLSIIKPVVNELKIKLNFIDLGGGLGIPYKDDEKELDVKKIAVAITEIINNNRSWIGENTKVYMEPARYFVGNAGFLIGTVHSIKSRKVPLIGTDISMNILARPAMYAEGGYHRILFNRRENDSQAKAGVCGQVCENTDFWIKERTVPGSVEVGDRIVVLDTGAYGYSMSYQYNGRLKPAEVLVDCNGNHRLIRYSEKYEDMLRDQIL